MALASDNFNRANENPLAGGTNWSTNAAFDNLQIVANQVNPSVVPPAKDNIETWAANAFADEQYAQIKVAVLGGAGNNALGVGLRQATTTADGYLAGLTINPAISFIGKWVAGVNTVIASNTTIWAVGDILRGEVQGTTLTVIRNGVVDLTGTDTSFASGRAGAEASIAAGGLTTDVALDDWEAGNLELVGSDWIPFQVARWKPPFVQQPLWHSDVIVGPAAPATAIYGSEYLPRANVPPLYTVQAYNLGFWFERSLLPGTTLPPADTAVYGSEWLQPWFRQWPSRRSILVPFGGGGEAIPPTTVYGSEWIQPFHAWALRFSYNQQQDYLWQTGFATEPVYPDTSAPWFYCRVWPVIYAWRQQQQWFWQFGYATEPVYPDTSQWPPWYFRPWRVIYSYNQQQDYLFQSGIIVLPPAIGQAIYGSEWTVLPRWPVSKTGTEYAMFYGQQGAMPVFTPVPTTQSDYVVRARRRKGR